MISGIVAGIAKALYLEFQDSVTIYDESIEQDFKEPCFLISTIKAAESKVLNRRYKFSQSFVIQYFPKSKRNVNEEMYRVADRMVGALEYIEQLGTEEKTTLRGKDRNYKIVDGVLNFFVDYNFFAYVVVEEPPFMEVIKISRKGEEDGKEPRDEEVY